MFEFLKRTTKCERCKKHFKKFFWSDEYWCRKCWDEWLQKIKTVQGYVDYSRDALKEQFKEEEWGKIKEHQLSILEKYRVKEGEGISESDLQNFNDITSKGSIGASDGEQMLDILERMTKTQVNPAVGAVFTSEFFISTKYEGVVIDAKDVFAIGFGSTTKIDISNHETIMCALFTNDPYIPVFPIVFLGKIGFLELTKSKKGRQNVMEILESKCPNLTYPIQELKTLKKQIQKEKTIKGNIDKQFMLDKILEAECSSKIFDFTYARVGLTDKTKDLLKEFGYN